MRDETIPIRTRLSPAVLDALKARAAAEGRPIAQMVRRLVEEGLQIKPTPAGSQKGKAK